MTVTVEEQNTTITVEEENTVLELVRVQQDLVITDVGVQGIKGDDGLPGEDGTDGIDGLPGEDGIDGLNGWSPVVAVATDGERRVLQVVDWTGGTGTKPATGYIGVSGIVALIADAVDIRGSQGVPGDDGNTNVFIQTTAPVGVIGPYLWVNTTGGNLQFLIEDGS